MRRQDTIIPKTSPSAKRLTYPLLELGVSPRAEQSVSQELVSRKSHPPSLARSGPVPADLRIIIMKNDNQTL